MYTKVFFFFLLGLGFFFPTSTEAKPAHKALIQILLQDADDPKGPILKSAYFQDKHIPLRPRSPNKVRAVLHERLLPGKYTLRWTLEKPGESSGKSIQKKETITIRPQDVWINILVDGEELQFL